MSRRIASLGMYDLPGVQWANDRIWAALAERLVAAGIDGVPHRLDRARSPAEAWSDPDLLLGQCCGYPLATTYAGRLRYVATPGYAVPGCSGSAYRSRIVVRTDDPADALSALRGRRAAINDRRSNSGMNLFRAAVAPLAGRRSFFSTVIETGSHAGSLRAVADGTADVAAIDTVSFAHLRRQAADIAVQMRTIGWTEATAGLPLVTAWRTSDAELAALRQALDAVFADPETAAARDALFIDGLGVVPDLAHRRIAALERRAVRAGYPRLA